MKSLKTSETLYQHRSFVVQTDTLKRVSLVLCRFFRRLCQNQIPFPFNTTDLLPTLCLVIAF